MSARGLISFVNSIPNDKKSGGTVPAGVWCLHTTSTTPFVLVQSGETARVFTWGEAILVESQGTVMNVSAHRGDIHLSPVVEGVVALRPAQYSIVAEWQNIVTEEGPAVVSQWLDVRNARRAFLTLNVDPPLPLPLFIDHSNEPNQNAPRVGLAVGLQSNAAAASGIVTEQRTINAVNQYSLGLRARDVPPGDPYPHMLLARVRVRFVGADNETFITADPFFHVEF
jgi:hypothetical protein